MRFTKLNDSAIYRRYDSADMLSYIDSMPELCDKAWKEALRFELPRSFREINKVVILGMGGSAIGGDLVASLVIKEARLPIFLHRDYRLPAFVDDRTLVIASSYSGATEETLAAFSESLKTGAKKLAITSGSELKSVALEKNIPTFVINFKSQPRAALPFSIMPILGFLQRLGFIADKTAEVAEAVDILRKRAEELTKASPLASNEAKRLASRIYDHIAVIYGAEHLSPVARRWKTDINENGKNWAFHEVFPELNHNSVVGYEFPGELAKKLFVVLLSSRTWGERIKMRYEITCELLDKAGVSYEVVESQGKSPLPQVMGTVLLGDYVSYYLAILNSIDPTPVRAVDYLKEKMGKVPNLRY